MGKVHVISAKHFGFESKYDYIPFPVDKFSKAQAMAAFKKVTRYTTKSNGKDYPYTAYEYDGEVYYSIEYSGTADESEFM